MPAIQNIGQSVRAPGPVDYATARPSQAPTQIGQVAAGVSGMMKQLADEDAAVAGLKTLSDFDAQSAARLAEMQRTAETPDGFGTAWAADWQQRADTLIANAPNDSVATFLHDRLMAGRERALTPGFTWEASAKEDLQAAAFKSSLDQMASGLTTDPSHLQERLADIDGALEPFDPVKKAALRTAARQRLGQSYIDGVIRQDPARAKSMLESGGLDSLLDPEVRSVAADKADRKIKELEAEAKGQQREAAATIGQGISDYGAWLANGGAADLSRDAQYTWTNLQPLMGAQAASAAVAQLEDARQIGGVTSRLMTSSAEDRSRMLADAADALKDPTDFERKSKRFGVISRAIGAFQQRLDADPAGVASQRPEVQKAIAALQAAQDNQGDHEQGRVVAAASRSLVVRSLQVQESLGVPSYRQQPLPKAQLDDLVARVQNAKPSELSSVVTGITATYGAWSPQVFRQMGSKLSPMTRAAASLPFGGGPGVEFIASSLGTSTQNLKTAIGADSVKAVDEAIGGNQTLTDLAQSLALRGGGVQSAADMRALLTHAAYARVSSFNETPDQAVSRVVSDALGQYGFGKINGRPFRVPAFVNGRTMDASAIESGANALLRTIDLKGIDAPADAASPDVYSSSIRRAGYFVTNDDETGLILYDSTGSPVRRGGKEITIPWQQIPTAAPSAIPGLPSSVPLGGFGENTRGNNWTGQGGELAGATSNQQAREDVMASLRAAGYPEDVVNDPAAQWAMLKDNNNTPTRNMKPGEKMALYGQGPGDKPTPDPGLRPGGERWASRGPGDEPAPVAVIRDNSDAALRLMASMNRDYARMHEAVVQSQRDRQQNQALSDVSTTTLRRRLEEAKRVEDRDLLIGELTDRARGAKTAAARQAILKELDKHWADASFKQRMLIMSVHVMDAAEGGVESAAALFK